MNEIKQSTPSREENVTRIPFWGTIALSAIALLVYAYFSIFLLRQPKTPVIYIALTVFLSSFVSAIVSIVLTARHRQVLGVKLAFYTLFIMGITIIAVLQGRAQTASFSILVLSVIEIMWLLPRGSRSWYSGITAAAMIVMWAIEWINPPWRIAIAAATVGPAAVIVFGIILGIIAVIQSWKLIANSLRYKLLAAFLGVTLIVLVSLGIYFNTRLRTVLNQNTQQNLSQLADQTAHEVDTFIGNQLKSVNTESQNPLYAQFLSLDPERRTSSTEGSNAQATLVNLANQDTTNINSYTLLDQNGKIVLDSANHLGEDDSQFGFFKDAIAKNQPTITGPLFDQQTGKASLYFSAPVKSQTGTTLGVLVADYNAGVIEALVETLIPAGNPNAILFRVVDKENFVRIAHTDNLPLLYKPYKNIPADQIVALQKQNLLPPGSAQDILAAEDATVAGLENVAQAPYFVTASKTLGAKTLNTASPLKTVPWLAFVRQSDVTVTTPLQNQTRTIVIISLVLLGLVTLASFAFSQILSNPILNLTTVAQKISTGDLSIRAETKSQDEIGFLASTFNKMTDQLNDLIGSLEQRVAARTRNLELAAEVGRTVSQVRALDVMLKDACELILKEFNLYYVQVYLADPSQTTLQLEAGTGTVGAQLVGRGHNLPLNTGSINGRAATEKHAVVISDTTQSSTFRQNPLLPDTRGEMAVPLIVANKVVGVLDMQSSQPGVLTQEILPAFEALAGQLAVAIQNANLLAETEEARAQVQAQARRLVQEGWSEHLDAIHKPEQLGFVFDHNQVTPLVDMEESQLPENAQSVSVPISVTGESLGSLVVELDDETQRDRTSELVNVVARQVAQQIENLRLLESAERYRYEAEAASRRLTREGWKSYMETANESMKYIYDLREVRPLNGDSLEASTTVLLKVRDEVVGKFAIQGLDTNDNEAVDLANVVAQRLGAHIESLRQQDQTQSALSQSEKLFQASNKLTRSNNLQELTAAVVESLNIPVINRGLMAALNFGVDGTVESMDIIANWWNGTGHEATAVGTHYPLEVVRLMQMFLTPTALFYEDVFTDERIDAKTKELARTLNLRASAVLPLYAGSSQLGVLILEAEEVHKFTQDDIRLFTSLAPQIATVLENRRQFERAQQQANRESTLNIISQKIQSATSVEAVLQIAARELGHALGAPMTVAQLSMKDKS